eukprot:5618283-Pleurochrysis_carterae.AAC.2
MAFRPRRCDRDEVEQCHQTPVRFVLCRARVRSAPRKQSCPRRRRWRTSPWCCLGARIQPDRLRERAHLGDGEGEQREDSSEVSERKYGEGRGRWAPEQRLSAMSSHA